mmetsp:Transcript_22720/g.48233  ORF Transcript_22720/g.48233 Transcript_22720/m.48233 type:complete len:162 (+) Transcript_22720:107-592(+)
MPVETTGSTLVTDIGCLVGERNQSERCPRNAASCLRAQPTTFMEQPSNEPTGFANLQRRGCVHPRRLVSRSSLWSIVVCAVEREREREEKKKKKKKKKTSPGGSAVDPTRKAVSSAKSGNRGIGIGAAMQHGRSTTLLWNGRRAASSLSLSLSLSLRHIYV